MNETSKFKCPYCGSIAIVMCSKRNDQIRFKVKCVGCGSRTAYEDTREGAKNRWIRMWKDQRVMNA